MNLQQLEYIVAIEREQNFVRAAKSCFVTQATLSMMIKKLENELGIKIFNRLKQPILPTNEGKKVLEYAKKIIAETSALKGFAKELKGEITGELRIGVIPTVAPYLLPLFLKKLVEKYPLLKIKIREHITEDIITLIKRGELDVGILATPLNNTAISEYPLFYEEFFAYASKSEKLPAKKYLIPKQINPHHLWLLEEGHCMRSQLINLCSLKKQDETNLLHYEAGSIETLINLVDKDGGITIIPQLSTVKLSSAQRKKLREFAPPKPVREISLVTVLHYPRKKIVDSLKEIIISSVGKNIVVEQDKKIKVIEARLKGI